MFQVKMNRKMKEKECPNCHQLLTISKFTKDKNRKDGLNFYCKKCQEKKSRELMNRWEEDRLQNTNISKEIEYTRCHKFLLPSMFNKRRRNKSGLVSICRNCDSIRNKEYRARIKREIERGQRQIIIPKRKKCRGCKRVLLSSKFTKDTMRIDGLGVYCKECDHKRQGIYRNKPEVKEKWSQYQKEYRSRPEVKEWKREYHKEYAKKPEYIQWKKEYEKRPERKQKKKEYMKKYLAKPEVKERIKQYLKEYTSRPDIIERRKKYLYDYVRRPDVKERRREYMKEYKQRIKGSYTLSYIPVSFL